MTRQDLYAELGDIRICYRQDGPPDAPALFLIPGLGMQLIEWPEDLVDALSQDYRVIRMDNRDCGLSSRCGGPFSNVPSGFSWAGSPAELAPYGLSDMADDVIALADHLGLKPHGCIGFSMGGMIAQLVAIRAQGRVTSIVSICSTGGESLLSAEPDALRQMEAFFLPLPTQADAMTTIQSCNAYFSRGTLPFDGEQNVRLSRALIERARDEGGYLRQALALTATPAWADSLAGLTVPALFLHGNSDPCIKAESAQRIAADMSKARCYTYSDVGHWIDDKISEQIVSWLDVKDRPNSAVFS
ncbi:Pimeloyl-ACP methyl ester carboxylesterase [Cohaesibacter sp. ES.047]|uniref:alpha/beta fold hydrolase n=1 Tax=Cohaesibacter sp. ES.047 TaxID=1798205 RepID=UPI000BB92E5D|nr:alpha/beta hydrolase [Cohaesibacter sp. ES.047]SNY89901.1 Pimeloyl-ACP methyl ester carboxylesterase [Cohaesibacter sp. ES.047]